MRLSKFLLEFGPSVLVDGTLDRASSHISF